MNFPMKLLLFFLLLSLTVLPQSNTGGASEIGVSEVTFTLSKSIDCDEEPLYNTFPVSGDTVIATKVY